MAKAVHNRITTKLQNTSDKLSNIQIVTKPTARGKITTQKLQKK